MSKPVRFVGRCIGISVSAGLASVGVVALRHALETPQPLKSPLPGEALLYRWRRRSIFYKVLGPEGAPPFVLLHAPEIGASAREMQYLMAPLARTYRVYAPDLLGSDFRTGLVGSIQPLCTTNSARILCARW